MSPFTSSITPLLLLLLLVVSGLNVALSAHPLFRSCNRYSRSTGQVAANIGKLLPVLVSGAESSGYIATSYGAGSDKVYGLAQCRGDVSRGACSSCIKHAISETRKQCPKLSDVRIWYDYCFLRYNQENFIGALETSLGVFIYSKKNATDPRTFHQKLSTLISQVQSQAVEPKNHGFGKGEIKVSPSTTLYAVVQCTRDLSPANCTQCLKFQSDDNYCMDRTGCRYFYSTCYTRYDIHPVVFSLGASNTPEESLASTTKVFSP